MVRKIHSVNAEIPAFIYLSHDYTTLLQVTPENPRKTPTRSAYHVTPREDRWNTWRRTVEEEEEEAHSSVPVSVGREAFTWWVW